MRTYGASYSPVSENKQRCIESVADGGRSVSLHQCSRKRGFGPNGEYCKQHAPKSESSIRSAWIVDDEDILEVSVLSETAKTISLKPVGEPLLGSDSYIYTGYINKEKYNLFDTKSDAAEYLKEKLNKEIEHHMNGIKYNRELIKVIEEIIG